MNNVDIGYLIKQDTMIGKVTMSFAAKGNGFKPATLNTDVSADVSAAYLKGYNYRDLSLQASARRGNAKVDGRMNDKNLAFNLYGSALFDDKYATNIKLRLLLDSILTSTRLYGNICGCMAS